METQSQLLHCIPDLSPATRRLILIDLPEGGYISVSSSPPLTLLGFLSRVSFRFLFPTPSFPISFNYLSLFLSSSTIRRFPPPPPSPLRVFSVSPLDQDTPLSLLARSLLKGWSSFPFAVFLMVRPGNRKFSYYRGRCRSGSARSHENMAADRVEGNCRYDAYPIPRFGRFATSEW